MKKIFRCVISLVLCVLMITTSVTSVAAQSTADEAEILSTSMDTNADSKNIDEYYYSNEEWEEKYPNGLYVVEYDSYGIYEGGSDAENPEDVYLGIVVYRIGGNNYSDTVTYYVTGVSADEELYPNSMGTVSFEPQQVTATAKIKITNDDVRRGDQLLMFTLESAELGEISASSAALVTITDDEPYVEGEISISAEDFSIDKSEGGADITISRDKSTGEYATLTIYTVDGTAKAGVDYEAVEKEVVFSPGEAEKTVTIPFIQTEEKFTSPKNFTVAVKDLKGCKLFGSDSIRVDFTNTLSSEANKLTEVTAESDFEISAMESLAESTTSVMNVNDNFDRKQMLLAAVGSANGTAVQSKPGTDMRLAVSDKWYPYLYVGSSDFYALYNNGEAWVAGQQYNDGNQDLMLASKEKFNLNEFTDVYYSFQNHRVLLNGFPNTAVGYFKNDGTAFAANKFTFTHGSLSSSEDSNDYRWMTNNKTYIFGNYQYTDVDKMGSDFVYSTDLKNSSLNGTLACSFTKSDGTRYPNTEGMNGVDQSLFFMLYDDDGWDDHHFTLDYAVLKRDIIPVDILKGEGVSNFAVNEELASDGKTVKSLSVSFEKDNYKWTVTPVETAGGIVETNDGYGFYAGSQLKFTFTSLAATGQATPTPEYIFVCDEKGVVHNSSKVINDNYFIVDLETLMSQDISVLKNQYYMSEEEAKRHASEAVSADRLISSRFNGKINLDIRYTVKQSINLSYANVPVLCKKAVKSNGNTETDSEYTSRVMSVLNGVVEFYLNGKKITPSPVMNRTSNVLQYPETEFDYIKITPSAMGVGAVVTSNLWDVKYVRMESATEISNETCRQNSSEVLFQVLSPDTTYVNPTIQLESVSVNKKVNGEFETQYIANHLDRNIPFEALYSDTTSTAKDISYYTVDFKITDIYIAGATNCEEKNFNVAVYDEDTLDKSSARLLFNFVFTGGKIVSSSKTVEATELASSFTKYDTGSVPEYINKDDFKPVVKLLGLSSEGYSYRMYIPTFYSYHTESDYAPYYETIFGGNDGVRIEVAEIIGYDSTAKKNIIGDVVATLGVNETQYVCTQIPNFDSEGEAQNGEAPYSEIQQEFYTYRENCLLLGSPNLSIDCMGLTTFAAKMIGASNNRDELKTHQSRLFKFAGSGVYIKLGSDTITIGAKIGYAPDHLAKKSVVPYVFGDASNVTSEQARALQTAANSKAKAASVGFMADLSIHLTYNTLSHKYDFTKFMFTGTVSGTISASIPIVPMVFCCITTTLAGSFGLGFMQVLNYVDQKGVSHYKTLWSGVPINIAFSISGTIGLGFSGIVAVEAGLSFDTALSFTLAPSEFTPIQSEHDIYTTSTQPKVYSLTYTGDWEYSLQGSSTASSKEVVGYESYVFNDTLVRSKIAGSTLSITTNATSVQITGVADEKGGVMKVTVKNTATGEILKSGYVNTYSDKKKNGATLYSWSVEDYTTADPLPVEVIIEHSEESAPDKAITLDSIRITNPKNYKSDIGAITFNNFFFKLALALKITMGPWKLSLDPAYMQFNVTEKNYSVTLGTLGYSHTWNYQRSAMLTAETGEEDIPLIIASGIEEPSTMDSDYFDLGDYGREKVKTLLAGDVEASSNTRTVYHNGKVYAFYSAMTKDQQGKFSYNLYCSVDGEEAKPVTESEAFINNFYVFEDENGNLVAELITADSTFSHIEIADNGAATVYFTSENTPITITEPESFNEILKHICVKVAVFDETTGTFPAENISVIESTDGNGRAESIPAAANGGESANVVFYVVDEETSDKADFNMNMDSRVDGINEGMQATKEFYDVIYSGRSELRYAVYKDGKIVDENVVKADSEELSEQELKPGYKITEISAVMADENTVCIAYKAEHPYSVQYGHTGTLKEIYWRTGEISDSGKLSFGDKLIVESIMDFDDNVGSFDEKDREKLTERYYDPESGEYYSEIVLGSLQMKKANVCVNGEDPSELSDEPCLFYATNASINYITYEAINKALKGEENSGICTLYDDYFESFVVAVSENGAINLVYSEETEKYQDTLYFMDYNSEDNAWTKPRRLTYSDVFDEDAFKDYETTASLNFDSFDAYVNDDEEVSVVLRSSYVPFIYELSAESDDVFGDASVDAFANSDYEYVDENNETIKGIVYPTPDYTSELARSDIFSLTFKEPVTDIEVTNFNVLNPVFVAGETVDVTFDIDNVGDTIVEDITVELYYKNQDSGSTDLAAYKEYTGRIYAGDSVNMSIDYIVDRYIEDNTLLGIRVVSGIDLLYDSLDDYQTDAENESNSNSAYYLINNAPEFVINAVRADINGEGVLDFAVEVKNYGTLAATEGVVLYCKVYDDSAENNYIGTLFTYTIDSSRLEVNEIALIKSSIDAASWLVDGKLYYNFELESANQQFTTENDKLDMSICYQKPDIDVNSTAFVESTTRFNLLSADGSLTFDMMIGDEIELNANVVGDNFDVSQLSLYEIGTDCLSIDNSAANGIIKIKAVDLPNGHDGCVKALIHLRDTSVYRYIYINITNKTFVEFDDSVCDTGWELSGQDHVYAVNFDLARTESTDSEINFKFYGDKLEIIGDSLTNGGDFELTVTDSKGKVVSQSTVSTKAEKNGFGKVLYVGETFGFGEYNVKLKASIEDGEKLSLDRAVYLTDTSSANTTPYNVVNSYTEKLDAPLVSGRQRKASFTLNFSKNIALAEGKELSDMTLSFKEFRGDGGEYTETGEEVIFTATEIKGKQLVFTAPLSSEPGYVMKYVLSDASIAQGFIVDENGKAAGTAIPDYDMVSYILKESGILSVTVADDEKMPDGSVHRSVQVKFATAPDTHRLEGTKLLYTTTDYEGNSVQVEFKYASMTNDPRVAVYRADFLELSEDELTKTYSFEEGIVLSTENFVLVTAKGDYLDNDISTVIDDNSDLDITYTKSKSESTNLQVTLDSGKAQPVVYISFEDEVDLQGAVNNAYIIVKETTVKGDETFTRDLVLKAQNIKTDGKTVTFKGVDTVNLSDADSVEYAVTSNKIQYSYDDRFIVTAYEKIAVNPSINSGTVKFNTGAYIETAEPFVDENGKLSVKLTFSTEVDAEMLSKTFVNVTEEISEYSRKFKEQLELEFVSAEVVEQGVAKTVATYVYSGDEKISLEYEEISKRFVVDGTIGIKGAIEAVNGENILEYILSSKVYETSRLQASSGKITLVENGDAGYYVQLTLAYPENVSMPVDGTVFTTLNMTTGADSQLIYLMLDSVENNTVVFKTDSPITLDSAEVITFETPERFTDSMELIVDSQGVGVSEYIGDFEDLLIDNSNVGLVQSAEATFAQNSNNAVYAVAKVNYNEVLREASFTEATLKVYITVTYADGTKNVVNKDLVFDSLDSDTAALFKAELGIPEDAVEVQMILGDSITPFGTNMLYNKNRTLSLSTELPEANKAKVQKLSSVVTAIIPLTDGAISSLEDIAIAVTYPKKIVADNLEGITLKVKVEGVEGVTEVMFTASETYGNNTVVFRLSDKVEGKLANVVTLSLENAKINVAESSSICAVASGISVNLSVNDISESFMAGTDTPVTNPTEPTTTETTITEPSASETTAVTSPQTETAISEAETTLSDSTDTPATDAESGDSVTTGQNSGYINMVVVIMVIAFAVIVLLRTKKVKQ